MQTLDVVTVISNPCRYQSRYRLYKDFAAHVAASGARLTTVEAAFQDRPFEVTEPNNPRHIQVRVQDELWHKENLINIGISRLPDDADYVSWADADIEFRHRSWAEETVQALQHYEIVQMFSHAVDLGPEGMGAPVTETAKGFVYQYLAGKPYGFGSLAPGKNYEFWHPGFAWAANRSALDKVEGLMDWTLAGAADHIMALALIGKVEYAIASGLHPNYYALANRWQYHAEHQIKRDVGYVPGTIFHHWHGSKANRKYIERWDILRNNQFDPLVDVMRDSRGLLRLTNNKPGLRDDLRKYFRQRNEDSLDI